LRYIHSLVWSIVPKSIVVQSGFLVFVLALIPEGAGTYFASFHPHSAIAVEFALPKAGSVLLVHLGRRTQMIGSILYLFLPFQLGNGSKAVFVEQPGDYAIAVDAGITQDLSG
jgi:hypothetical protein